MTKRLLILSTVFIGAAAAGEAARPLCADSVVDLDDEDAAQVLASGRGKLIDPKDPKAPKLRDTTKEHEAASAERANATPENLLAGAIAQAAAAAVKAVLEQQAATAATAAAAAAEPAKV